MKKKSILFGTVFSLSLLLTSWTIAKNEDSAVHISDFNCGVLDGGKGFFLTDKSKSVVTPSGNQMLSCKASGVPNKTEKTVKWNFENTKYVCRVMGKITKDWDEVVTPSGQVSLMCKIN